MMSTRDTPSCHAMRPSTNDQAAIQPSEAGHLVNRVISMSLIIES